MSALASLSPDRPQEDAESAAAEELQSAGKLCLTQDDFVSSLAGIPAVASMLHIVLV